MTGIALQQGFRLRRITGMFWLTVIAVTVAALAAGSFVLGRVTDSSGSNTIAPVRTVWLQPVGAGNAPQPCHVHRPC
jgi:hypothetical protein